MPSPDQDQISLDDLFAAVGVSVPAEDKAEEPVKEPYVPTSTAPDTTEQDLLSALGIPHIGTVEKRATQEATVDAESDDGRERHEDQRTRASQWRHELQEAPDAASSSASDLAPEREEAPTQPLQASVASLPTLSGSSIQPFGVGSEPRMGQIGALEATSASQPSSVQPTYPSHQDAHPSAQPAWAVPGGQPVGPSQPSVASPSMPQPAQQQPQAAFQQAQQMPLQPLQPVDQPPAGPQAQAAPLPSQPFQRPGEGPSLQGVEQQVAQDALQQSQAPMQPAMQTPSLSPQQPGMSPQPIQQPATQPSLLGEQPNVPSEQQGQGMSAASLWQQQMAQQVSAIHSNATETGPDSSAQPELPSVAPSDASGAPQPDARGAVPASFGAPNVPQPASPQAPVPTAAPMGEPLGQPQSAPDLGPQPQAMQPEAPAPLPENVLGRPSEDAQGIQGPPSATQGMPLMQPPVVSPQPPAGEALAELDKEAKSSKVAHVVGGLLIVIAVICVVFAICLLTGVIDLSVVNTNHAAQSDSNNTQLSSQAAPSATSTPSASEQPAMTSQSGSKAGDVVYSYVVRGVDGGTHEAVETATFGEDGKLVSSTLEIQTESQMDSEKLLDQLKQEFGESLMDSSATENMVICTVQLPRDDLDRDSYTELLSTNAPEFKVLSS